MRDLSKFNIPKNPAANKVEIEQKSKNSKKKILVITAVVVLLTIAVTSKIINKHLKKLKAEEAAVAEMVSDDNKALSTDLDAVELSTDSNKTPYDDAKTSQSPDTMTFTFYNNLKNETVVVDAIPQSERAQDKYTYMFQIASFRNMDETKYYTQKLDSVGLKPTFEKVGGWIRMSIGPYDSTRAMAPDIIKLQKVGINMGFTREIDKVKIEPVVDKSDKKV